LQLKINFKLKIKWQKQVQHQVTKFHLEKEKLVNHKKLLTNTIKKKKITVDKGDNISLFLFLKKNSYLCTIKVTKQKNSKNKIDEIKKNS
jgi:hypothetical protein